MSNLNSQIISQPEIQKILHGISNWETSTVESFLDEVRKILVSKKNNKLSKRETELFLIINKAIFSEKEWESYSQLNSKFEEETINKKEQKELDEFVKRLESYGLKRLRALIELAEIRDTTLDKLMKELGIKNITPDATKKSHT